MDRTGGYYEQKRHGDAGFDFNIYPCTIPGDFPRVALHWQDGMELVVIRSGAGVVRAGFERFDAAAGDVFVFTPGMLHGIEQADGQRMDYENILFSLDLLGGREDVCTERYLLPMQAGRITLPVRLRPGERGYDRLLSCLNHLDEANRLRPVGYELAVKGALMELLALLLELGERPAPVGNPADGQRLKEVLGWIEAHYAGRITVADAAAVCNLSQSHFMRWFKESTGSSFVAYLNDYRLLMAAEALRRGGDGILTISGQCGFENLSYFNRCFKKRFGLPPSRYRAAQQRTQ